MGQPGIVPGNSVEGIRLNAFKAARHRNSDWILVRGRCLGDEERDGRVVWADVAVRTTTEEERRKIRAEGAGVERGKGATQQLRDGRGKGRFRGGPGRLVQKKDETQNGDIGRRTRGAVRYPSQQPIGAQLAGRWCRLKPIFDVGCGGVGRPRAPARRFGAERNQAHRKRSKVWEGEECARTETFEGWIGVEDDVYWDGGKGSPTGAEIRRCKTRSRGRIWMDSEVKAADNRRKQGRAEMMRDVAWGGGGCEWGRRGREATSWLAQRLGARGSAGDAQWASTGGWPRVLSAVSGRGQVTGVRFLGGFGWYPSFSGVAKKPGGDAGFGGREARGG
ncbi:hypothetical protein C8J57DRAFT_1562772 [Mycena rebaudengoi]|nr:hypothetical protein C8J57DRAFT_1562772 [Mycena rebaudengoi]